MFNIILISTALMLVSLIALSMVFFGVRLLTSLYFGVGTVLALFCIETWFVSLPAIKLGLNIYPQDLIFISLSGVGIIRVVLGKNINGGIISWLVFGVIMAISLCLGIFKYGTAAGVDLRPVFYFWSVAIFIASFRIDLQEADKLIKLCLISGGLVLLIVLYRWISDALHLGVPYNHIGAGKFLRVLTAGQTYMLAALAIILAWVVGAGKASVRIACLFVPFIMAVLLLQHRSVWVATLAALVFLYIAVPQLRSRFLQYSFLGIMLITIALVPLYIFGGLDSIIDALGDSVEEALQSKGSTFTWRLQSTHELFMQWINGGPLVYLIGKPFGSGYERYLVDLGHTTNYSPHNFYIQLLLRVGLLGTIAVVVAYLIAIYRLWTCRKIDSTVTFIGFIPFAAILISSLVFFYPYGAHFIQGVFLGIAFAIMPRKEKNSVTLIHHNQLEPTNVRL